MVQEQSHQELIDLKILLKECFIAECELGSFLLDKANVAKVTEFSVDDHFKLKAMSDRVLRLIHEIQLSDEQPPDKLPVYLGEGVPLASKFMRKIVERRHLLVW
jgi:hypothetical protein